MYSALATKWKEKGTTNDTMNKIVKEIIIYTNNQFVKKFIFNLEKKKKMENNCSLVVETILLLKTNLISKIKKNGLETFLHDIQLI